MSLTLLTLALSCARPAQAQDDWNVTDNAGNLILILGGGYPLTGTATGGATNTYPPDMTFAAQIPPYNDPIFGWVDNSQWLQSASNGPHSYDPNPLGVPYLYTDGTAGPSGTSVALNTTAHNYAFNNSYYGSFNPEASPFFTYQTYKDVSDCEPVIGNVTGRATGTLWANWNWTGRFGRGAPDHLDILLTTLVRASKSFEGQAEQQGTATQAGTLTATSTASDGDPFNETATSDGGGQVVGGRHLLRVPVSGGVAAVSLNGNVQASATNTVPYGGFGYPYFQIYGGNNMTGALSAALVSATASIDNDNREVAITADVNTTSYKILTGGVDANGDGSWAKVAHTPEPDGTMRGDIGIPYGEQHTTYVSSGTDPGSTSELVVTSSNRPVTYTGHIPGNWATQNAQYWWKSSLKNYNTSGTLFHLSGVGLPTEAEIPTMTNVYVGPVVDSDHNGAIIPNEAGANGTTDHISFRFQNGDNRPNYPTGNDGDGATATANYHLTIHQPMEVFQSNRTSEIKYRVASPSPAAGEIPMSFQGLDYSTYKGSGSNGISALCVINSPSLYWSTSSDVTSVLSSVPYPGWWGLLDVIFAGANIAINHDTPVPDSFSADFDDVAWDDPQSSGDDKYNAKSYAKAFFHMSPRVRVNYRWHYKLVDVYDASGFKSETLQHDEEYVGPQNAFGVFTYLGPGS